MKAILKPLVALLILAALGAAGYYYYYFQHCPGNTGNCLRLSGNIEVVDVAVSFKIAGRVETRPVDEGQRIARGDLVAELDTSQLRDEAALRRAELQAADAALAELLAGSRKEEIAAAAAALQLAAAALAELEAGSRPQEIKAAEARVTKALAEKVRAEDELTRATELYERKAISLEDYDQARAAYRVAAAQLLEATEQYKLVEEGPRREQIDQARAALAEAQAQYDLVEAGPRQETIDQARARVDQARAALRLAETQLGYATLRSPLDGVILSKNIEPGEYVVPGTPVVTVGDLEHAWLRVYVDGNDVGRVKPGQKALVTTDTWPDRVYEGRVSFISEESEFTPKSVQTQKERVKLVYRVKIDIHNPDMDLKPGMPADAEIVEE